MSLILPIDHTLVTRLLAEALSSRTSVPQVIRGIISDLGLTLEALQRANSIFISEHREPIVDVQVAIVRMGADHLTELLRELPTSTKFISEEHEQSYASLRTRSHIVSMICREIAMETYSEVEGEALVCGLLINLPLHLCCIAKPKEFLSLQNSFSLKALPGKVRGETKYHPLRESIRYLRRQCVPSRVQACLDWNIPCTAPRELRLRFLANAAKEIIEGYESKSWTNYMLRDSLPTKSAFRLLPLNDFKYERLFAKIEKTLEGSPISRKE